MPLGCIQVHREPEHLGGTQWLHRHGVGTPPNRRGRDQDSNAGLNPKLPQSLILTFAFQYHFVEWGCSTRVETILISNLVLSMEKVEGGRQGPEPHSACGERAHLTSERHFCICLDSLNTEVNIPKACFLSGLLESADSFLRGWRGRGKQKKRKTNVPS